MLLLVFIFLASMRHFLGQTFSWTETNNLPILHTTPCLYNHCFHDRHFIGQKPTICYFFTLIVFIIIACMTDIFLGRNQQFANSSHCCLSSYSLFPWQTFSWAETNNLLILHVALVFIFIASMTDIFLGRNQQFARLFLSYATPVTFLFQHDCSL